jgi:hypothetical protein
MYELLAQEHPMGVRQVYYRITVLGLVEKIEKNVKGVVGRLLSDMRRKGEIPFDWIHDSGREPIEPLFYVSAGEAAQSALDTYRENYWKDQPLHVEVWLEKDGLTGIFEQVTWPLGVRLMSTHGNGSISFLHNAAKVIAAQDKPVILLNFGDHDWSGHNIKDTAVRDIRQWAPDADITVTRIAVTPEQIQEWDLPTRPPKDDVRAKNWEGDCVELDAIPPAQLRELIEASITRLIDWKAWKASERKEQAERKKLEAIIRRKKGST